MAMLRRLCAGRFPPVLNLQLKRFSFDMELMDRVRSNFTSCSPSSLGAGAGR